MKKIIFTALTMCLIITTNTVAEKIDCTEFDKVSAKYLKCSARNLKEKSSELKLRATIGAEDFKEKITTNAKNSKTKFNKSSLKEKLVKFKNSKTLTKFLEN